MGEQVVPGNCHPPAPQSACAVMAHARPVQQAAVSDETVAPAGVGTLFKTNAAPVPGRQSPTAMEPVLAGATSLWNRKLNMVPQRSTLALWSLPVPGVKGRPPCRALWG